MCVRELTLVMCLLRFKSDSNLNIGKSNTTLWTVRLASNVGNFVESLRNVFSKPVTPSILSGNTISISKFPPCTNSTLHNKCIVLDTGRVKLFTLSHLHRTVIRERRICSARPCNSWSNPFDASYGSECVV